jgi:zinc finger protein 830
MSASLKKKYTQHDLRRLMNEQKAKQQTTKDTEKVKITSPLAKYNDQGQLTCVLCKSVVRSESVWTVHINAKQHKQNVELAKQLKERGDQVATKAAPVAAFKRPASSKPENSIPQKIIKSILRKYDVDVPAKPINGMSDMSKLTISEKIQPSTSQQLSTSSSKPEETDEKLPEGFFDDPHLDAKVSSFIRFINN